MQTRSTNSNHHHQEGFSKEPGGIAEAELLGLAKSKGQTLAEHTLRLIRETLELKNISLEAFVNDVRPHFRNNILNPSGFLINRARRFHELVRVASAQVCSDERADACGKCNGQMLVLEAGKIEACPKCATPEFRKEWRLKEAERIRRTDSGLRLPSPVQNI